MTDTHNTAPNDSRELYPHVKAQAELLVDKLLDLQLSPNKIKEISEARLSVRPVIIKLPDTIYLDSIIQIRRHVYEKGLDWGEVRVEMGMYFIIKYY